MNLALNLFSEVKPFLNFFRWITETTNLPKTFRLVSYDRLITDVTSEYPNENFLAKLEKHLRDLDLNDDVISALITNSTAKNWPAFVLKKLSTSNKPQRNENIDSLRQYKCN